MTLNKKSIQLPTLTWKVEFDENRSSEFPSGLAEYYSDRLLINIGFG